MSHPPSHERKQQILAFIKSHWWKFLIALAVLAVGAALCATAIGALAGIPLIVSVVADSLAIVSSLSTLASIGILACGLSAVTGALAYIIGKVNGFVRGQSDVVKEDSTLEGTSSGQIAGKLGGVSTINLGQDIETAYTNENPAAEIVVIEKDANLPTSTPAPRK